MSDLAATNCGGCGYAGCEQCAKAINEGLAEVNACPVGGSACAEEIAKILGKEADSSDPVVAFVSCMGSCDKAGKKYDYSGANSCSVMKFVPGGSDKLCEYGCLGFGECVNVCKFDAIHIVDGVAVVDKNKCVGCGMCAKTCPKGLISLIPAKSQYAVACSSKDKGPVTMKNCSVGCIGCGLCVKQCENEAVSVCDFNATIDQTKCISCGKCFEKCPKKSIVKL